MMREISVDNAFFKNEEFEKDKYKFSLIGHNLGICETTIYSDEESYIFVLGKSHKPIWLWTKDNISLEKILEIKQNLEYFKVNGLTSFACKEKFYYQLSVQYGDLNIEELSGCYICSETVKPRKCDGNLEKAKIEDKDLITKMWYDDCVEANPDNHISYELAGKFVDKFLESNAFYVWRNNTGKIVSIVDYTVIDNYAEVAHAYTVPEERGKGYMANSVYTLTKTILENGLIPVLSTDYNYFSSNKCYQNIGYQLEDKLVVFSNCKIIEKEGGKTK